MIDGEQDGTVTTGLGKEKVNRGGDSDCAQIYPAPLDRLLLQERFQQCTERELTAALRKLLHLICFTYFHRLATTMEILHAARQSRFSSRHCHC